MKNVFYGISMGYTSPPNKTDKTRVDYSVYVMKRIITEILNVDAQVFLENGSNTSEVSRLVDDLLDQECVVFTFKQESYLSDLKKMNELILEEAAKDLLSYSDLYSNDQQKNDVVDSFKMCFQPYCIQEVLSVSLPKEQVLREVRGAVKRLTSMGRNLPLNTKSTIVNFLSQERVKSAAFLGYS